MSIQLWEQDNGAVADVLRSTADGFTKAGALTSVLSAPTWVGTAIPIIGTALNLIADLAEDDLHASQTFAYPPAFLASKAPRVGTSSIETLGFRDTSPLGGTYTLQLRISRVG
jgi:hypothetical protein